MNIPFVDLKSQYRLLREEILAGIERVLEHGQFIMGPEIHELEQALARFVGVRHAVACSSGTDALLMALMAYDVGPGDAVFTTSFTFIATGEVIALLGAMPVFADIDQCTFNIDPIKLEEAVSCIKKEAVYTPKVVIPVDLFGLPADYGRIMDIAGAYGVYVLEDAAQSFGGTYQGRRAGGLGHVAATSFFPSKPLGCYGDGGAVFTNDDDLAAKLDSIRIHGKGNDKYDNVRIGLNARLDTLQAAVLLPKLKILQDELQARQHVAEAYTARLKGVVKTPVVPGGSKSAWAQYSILSDQRDEIQAALKEQGVPTAVYYSKPLHLQTPFMKLGYKVGDFPVSETSAARILSLPMHPYLKDEDIDHITEIILQAVN
jgi:UDP-2-acetamido-2-deoxy-ribo-hexuluronate aminotransferase